MEIYIDSKFCQYDDGDGIRHISTKTAGRDSMSYTTGCQRVKADHLRSILSAHNKRSCCTRGLIF